MEKTNSLAFWILSGGAFQQPAKPSAKWNVLDATED
jgi:hypothetical protein